MSKKMIKRVDVVLNMQEDKTIKVNVNYSFPNDYGQGKDFLLMVEPLLKSKARISNVAQLVKNAFRSKAKCHAVTDSNAKFIADLNDITVFRSFIESYEDRDVLVNYLFSDEMKKTFGPNSGVMTFYCYDENGGMLFKKNEESPVVEAKPVEENFCYNCKHDGNQALYPSGCTGCGTDGERLNFEKKD